MKKKCFSVPTADVYQISNVKIVFCNKKSVFCFFFRSCDGAYNNVHKLSIHWIALFLLLFYHLPHIYSPFKIHTYTNTYAHTNFYSRTFNPFFPLCFIQICSCLFACNFFSLCFCFCFFSRILFGRLCLPFHHSSLYLFTFCSMCDFCRIFFLLVSNVSTYIRFGSNHNGTMMKMQMRWHNHSNLIHSIDFVRKFIRNKESLQLYCR